MPEGFPDGEIGLAARSRDALHQAIGEGATGTGKISLLAGLVGRGIQESRTPAMHEAEGTRLGLDYRYRLFDFDKMQLDDRELRPVVLALAEAGLAGLNVTHPFKEDIVANLDEVSPEAAAIGAVNTVIFRNGRRIGHNTDCWGFAESFRRGLHSAPLDKVVLVGAGGAGMAIAHALLQLGVVRLTISDIDPARASALAGKLAPGHDAGGIAAVMLADLESHVRTTSGVVNATPVGMAKYPGMPVPVAWLRRESWVADAVYFPLETVFLRAAREVGCTTLPGTGMAIFQAIKAFELIAGVVPDAGAMARHFDKA